MYEVIYLIKIEFLWSGQKRGIEMLRKVKFTSTDHLKVNNLTYKKKRRKIKWRFNQ